MSNQIDPKNDEQMATWAMSLLDPLSWRAMFALTNPDDPRAVEHNWGRVAHFELINFARDVYEAVVPDGYVVVRRDDLAWALEREGRWPNPDAYHRIVEILES